MAHYIIAIIHDSNQSSLKTIEKVSNLDCEVTRILEDFPVRVPIEESKLSSVFGYICPDGRFVSLDSVYWSIPYIGKNTAEHLFHFDFIEQLRKAARKGGFACCLAEIHT